MSIKILLTVALVSISLIYVNEGIITLNLLLGIIVLSTVIISCKLFYHFRFLFTQHKFLLINHNIKSKLNYTQTTKTKDVALMNLPLGSEEKDIKKIR